MEKKEQQHLDQFFKDRLEDNSIPPAFDNWEKIANHLEGEQLDLFVKKQLEEVAPTPPPRVWNNIKNQLPLSLWVRNHLNWMSKVAAILVIFMISVLVINKQEKKNPIETIAKTVDEKIEIPIIDNFESESLVFEIENTPNQIIEDKEEDFTLDIKLSEEDIFSLLEDEEDLDIDEEIVERGLEPYEELPSETAEASIQELENQPPLNFPQVETYSNDK